MDDHGNVVIDPPKNKTILMGGVDVLSALAHMAQRITELETGGRSGSSSATGPCSKDDLAVFVSDFQFPEVRSSERNVSVISSAVTITGTGSGALLTLFNGEGVVVNGSLTSSQSVCVHRGDRVQVMARSSPDFLATTTVDIQLRGLLVKWRITTRPPYCGLGRFENDDGHCQAFKFVLSYIHATHYVLPGAVIKCESEPANAVQNWCRWAHNGTFLQIGETDPSWPGGSNLPCQIDPDTGKLVGNQNPNPGALGATAITAVYCENFIPGYVPICPPPDAAFPGGCIGDGKRGRSNNPEDDLYTNTVGAGLIKTSFV